MEIKVLSGTFGDDKEEATSVVSSAPEATSSPIKVLSGEYRGSTKSVPTPPAEDTTPIEESATAEPVYEDRVARFTEDEEYRALMQAGDSEREGAMDANAQTAWMLKEGLATDEEFLDVPKSKFVPEDFTIEELANSDRFIRLASTYLTKRIGPEAGDARNYENKEDFVRRFQEHQRAIEDNLYAQSSELDYIKTLSWDEAQDVGKLYQLWPHITNVSGKEDGVEKAIDTSLNFANALYDHTKYLASDPVTWGTMGSSLLIRGLAGKVISGAPIKKALESQLVAITGTGTVDGALSYMDNADRQSMEILTGLRKNQTDIDQVEALTSAGFGALFGVGATSLATRMASKDLSPAEKLAAELQQKQKDGKIGTKAKGQETGAIEDEEARKALLMKFDPIRGIVARDKLQTTTLKIAESNARESDLVSPQVNSQIIDDVTIVIGEWMERNPQVRQQVEEVIGRGDGKISDVIGRLFYTERKNAEGVVETALKADSDQDAIYTALDEALEAAGVTKEEFAQAMRGTASEAGRTLRSYSMLTQQLKKMSQDDPDTANLVATLFDMPEETGMGFFTRLDAETRGIMVAGLGTTVANIFGATANMGFMTAQNTIESAIYHAGRATTALAKGEMSWEATKKGGADFLNDSMRLITNLVRQGRSDALSEAALQRNPELAQRLFHMTTNAADEVKDKELSAFTKSLNTLNIAQDRMFRRAVFADRVDFYLTRAAKSGAGGVEGNLEYYIANNLPIPKEILRRASDDSLKATFAYMPKAKTGKGLEDRAETLAHHTVKAIEGLPFVPVIGTGEYPFARFMTNAIAWQYKNSPLNVISNTGDVLKAGKTVVRGEKITEEQLYQMRSNVAKSVVGFGMFSAAVDYRMQHPELKPYEYADEQGRPVDARRAFPVVGYMVLADAWLSITGESPRPFDFATFVEGVTGSQVKSGQTEGINLLTSITSEMADAGFNILDHETWDSIKATKATEKLEETIGKYVADQAGRVLTPTQLINDIAISAGVEGADVVRNASWIEGTSPGERLFDSLTKQLTYKLPIANRVLKPLDSPTRMEELRKESTSVRSILPVRIQQLRTPIETEFAKYGISTSSLTPRNQDPVARAMYAEMITPFLDAYVSDVIHDDRYVNGSDAVRKTMLSSRISKAKAELTKKIGDTGLSAAEIESIMRQQQGITKDDAVARGMWLALPRTTRELVEEEYMKETGGTTIMESRDFRAGLFMAPLLKEAYQ